MLRQTSNEDLILDRTAEVAATVAEEGLRHVSDSAPGYTRKRAGTTFSYYDKYSKRITDAAVIRRKALRRRRRYQRKLPQRFVGNHSRAQARIMDSSSAIRADRDFRPLRLGGPAPGWRTHSAEQSCCESSIALYPAMIEVTPSTA